MPGEYIDSQARCVFYWLHGTPRAYEGEEPHTMANTRPITRDEAREAYLRVYDEFAVTVDEVDPAITHALEFEGLVVQDNVNGEYDIIQCVETYDSITRAQAEALFDKAWTSEHPTRTYKTQAGTTTDAQRATTDSWKCYCGCGRERRSKRTLFAPGHDARFASNLIKAVKAGAMTREAASHEAHQVSPAMGRKVDAALVRAYQTPQPAATANDSDWTAGYVTVNRRRMPAQLFTMPDGTPHVNINDAQDGSRDWLDGEGYLDKPVAHWVKRFKPNG